MRVALTWTGPHILSVSDRNLISPIMCILKSPSMVVIYLFFFFLMADSAKSIISPNKDVFLGSRKVDVLEIQGFPLVARAVPGRTPVRLLRTGLRGGDVHRVSLLKINHMAQEPVAFSPHQKVIRHCMSTSVSVVISPWSFSGCRLDFGEF